MLSHLTYILKREEKGRRHIEILLMELFRIRKSSDSMSCFTNNGYELDLFQPVRYGN